MKKPLLQKMKKAALLPQSGSNLFLDFCGEI